MTRNDATGFGWPSRLLHWTTAALILATIPLGLYIARTQPSLSSLWLFGLHKSIGATVLALTVARLLWHVVSPPPAPLSAGVAEWRLRLARAVHRGLYAGLLLTPLAGWAASSSTGIDTVIFDRWTLPRIAPVSEVWEAAGFAVHRALAWATTALVALHLAGAVQRAMRRDGTLKRMVTGRP